MIKFTLRVHELNKTRKEDGSGVANERLLAVQPQTKEGEDPKVHGFHLQGTLIAEDLLGQLDDAAFVEVTITPVAAP